MIQGESGRSIEQSLVSLGSPWSYRVEREQDRTFQSLEINRFLQVRPEEEEGACQNSNKGQLVNCLEKQGAG